MGSSEGQPTFEQWAGSLTLDHRVAAMVAPAAKVIPYRFILEDFAELAKRNQVQLGPVHAARVSRNTPAGATDIGFGFTGHEYDPETGLYYMKGRYYDPRTARFLTQDPATPDYTNPPSLHKYLYAYGNPTVYVDPDGRLAETVWDVISLGIGLGSLGYNLSEGNYRDAGIDALGVTADSIAALVPFLPGGAGAAIKAARVGTATVQQVNRARKVQRSVDALQAIDQGINAIQSASAAKENLEQGDLGWAAVNTTLGALGARGAASNTGAVAGNRYFDDVSNPRGPPPPSQVTVNVENPNGLGTVPVPQSSGVPALSAREVNGLPQPGRAAGYGAESRGATLNAEIRAPGTGASSGLPAPTPWQPRFWNKTDYGGTRIYQRDDLIDPTVVDARGRTNLQRMQKGLAPLGADGKSVNLHHATQRNDSPLVELTSTFHQQNSKIIHINPNTLPSGVDRDAFNKFRREYWKNRASDFSDE